MSTKQYARLAGAFIAVGVGWSCFLHFGPDRDSAASSIFQGAAIGLLATFMAWRVMTDPKHVMTPRIPWLMSVTALAGGIIVIVGLVEGSWNLVLAGLPLLCLGSLIVGAYIWQRRAK